VFNAESENDEVVLTSSFQILTNNPLVAENFSGRFHIEFFEGGSDREVLFGARNLVHQGHRVLTAPLSGSVKPWETPYRSILVTALGGDQVDAFSLDIMERALAIISKSKASPATIEASILHDFQVIDLSLIESAMPSLEATGRV
jgi:hypothetical protein